MPLCGRPGRASKADRFEEDHPAKVLEGRPHRAGATWRGSRRPIHRVEGSREGASKVDLIARGPPGAGSGRPIHRAETPGGGLEDPLRRATRAGEGLPRSIERHAFSMDRVDGSSVASGTMARSFTALDLVGLPNLDSASLVALARSLDAAAPEKDENKKPFRSTLPEPTRDGLTDMAIARDVLSAAVDKEPAPPPTVREADRREDNAALAMIEILGGWARLAGEIPEGDTAARVFERLFGKGSTKFINFPVKKEWAVIDGKLTIIREEQLDDGLKELGMPPVLKHLSKVHDDYGKAIGVTKAPAPVESAQLKAKREELLEEVRTYVVRVVGMRDKKKPQTNALVERLLKPLIDWEPAQAAAKPGPGAPAAAPSEENAPAYERGSLASDTGPSRRFRCGAFQSTFPRRKRRAGPASLRLNPALDTAAVPDPSGNRSRVPAR